METRASYMIVGVFTLLAVVGAVLFVLWTGKKSQGHMRTYEIIFHHSVSGLNTGGAVLLGGVRIGQVGRIRVSPDDPGQVIVLIQVAEDAPIRRNSTATLEPQGVTGMSAIAISGGTADSPILAATGGEIARIPSRPSRLQEIMNNVPSILAALDSILDRANEAMAPENTAVVGNLLVSIAEIAETLAKNKESIAKAIDGFGSAGESFAASGKRLEKLMANAQAVMDKEMRGAAKSVDDAASRFSAMAGALEPGVRQFSRGGFDELQRLLVEARRLASALAGLTRQLESDPRRFLFGNPIPEFSTP